MTKLITIPKFAELTGLPYRLCLHLVGTGQIPSVLVGRRRRIDVRWVDQWLASGGFQSSDQESLIQHREASLTLNAAESTRAAR
jgi:excisionase family DNA binding protein